MQEEHRRPNRYDDKLYVWAVKLLMYMAPFFITFVAGYSSIKSDLHHAELEISDLKETNKDLVKRIELLQIQVAVENRAPQQYLLPQSDAPISHNEKRTK